MNENEGKSYYVTIPEPVLHNNQLTPLARLVYGELVSLARIREMEGKEGYTWITNAALAERYEVSLRTITRTVTQLEDEGYIRSHLIYKEGTKEVQQRQIFISNPHDKNVHTLPTKMTVPSRQNCQEGPDKNVQDNNTVKNTSNNTVKESMSGKPDEIRARSEQITQIVDFLNETAGTKYRPGSQKTRDLITARLNEGFTTEDFKTVISKKTTEWQQSEKMAKFIRPETLFSNKFEGYLNEPAPKAAAGGYKSNIVGIDF
jgi:uncharacterized phage protein (TIGR02220 family)